MPEKCAFNLGGQSRIPCVSHLFMLKMEGFYLPLFHLNTSPVSATNIDELNHNAYLSRDNNHWPNFISRKAQSISSSLTSLFHSAPFLFLYSECNPWKIICPFFGVELEPTPPTIPPPSKVPVSLWLGNKEPIPSTLPLGPGQALLTTIQQLSQTTLLLSQQSTEGAESPQRHGASTLFFSL